MQHLDEGTIHAWLDGQLASDQANEISSHLSDCPACAAMVAEARGLVAASTRILTALDTVPAGVLPTPAERPARPAISRRWYQRTDVRAAAALLFVAGGSLLVVRRGERAANSPQAMMAVERTGVADTGGATFGKAEPAPTPDKPAPAADRLATSNAPVATMPTRARVPSAAAAPRTADMAVAQAPVDEAGKASPPAAIGGQSNRLSRANQAAALGALSSSAASLAVADDLVPRVVRVDSSTAIKQTVYEVAPGVEVTLAESPVEMAVEKSLKVREPTRRAVAMVPQRAPTESDQKPADSAASGAVRETMRRAVGGAAGALQTQRSPATRENAAGLAMAAPAAAQPPVKTITWIDNGRRYTLTGPLTEAQLELLKPRLMKAVRR